MTILALDTSTESASVCLYDREVLHEVTWRSGRNHTVRVAARIDAALREEALDPGALSGIAVAIGPGSFSGVRAGVAIAKSMALALGVPLVGIPTLDAIAHEFAWFRGLVLPMIDGGRGQIATALYSAGDGTAREVIGPALADLPSLLPPKEPTLYCGEISADRRALIERSGGPLACLVGPAARTRRAGFLAELAQERIDRGRLDDPIALSPIYLRRPAVLDRFPLIDEIAQSQSSPCPT